MNDRWRLPKDPAYFQSVGLATIAFARLEWNAVWCCHRLEAGYIGTIEPQRKTAGRIGKDLENMFLRISNLPLRAKVIPFAVEFRDVVLERNGLLHGKPGTAPNGDQRLFRHGEEWTIEAVDAFADRCVRAGAPLNALLYDELQEPCTVELN